jgi:hypothetical protein
MRVSPLEAVLSSSSPLEAVLSSSSRGTNREHTYDGKAGQPNSGNQCGQELKAKQLVADAPQPRVLQVLSTDRQKILEILGRAQAQRATAEEQQQLEENVARVNQRLRQLQENSRVKERIKQLQAIDAQLRPRRYAGMLPTDYSTGYIGEEKWISECIQDTLAGTLDEEDRGESSVKGGVFTSPVETDAEESDIAHMPRGPRVLFILYHYIIYSLSPPLCIYIYVYVRERGGEFEVHPHVEGRGYYGYCITVLYAMWARVSLAQAAASSIISCPHGMALNTVIQYRA